MQRKIYALKPKIDFSVILNSKVSFNANAVADQSMEVIIFWMKLHLYNQLHEKVTIKKSVSVSLLDNFGVSSNTSNSTVWTSLSLFVLWKENTERFEKSFIILTRYSCQSLLYTRFLQFWIKVLCSFILRFQTKFWIWKVQICGVLLNNRNAKTCFFLWCSDMIYKKFPQ